MFISDTLPEFVPTAEILTPISIDHSTVLFFLSKLTGSLRAKIIWKFNSSLTKDQNYISKIKK